MLLSSIFKREQKVLNLIAYEHTSKEISTALFISEHTAISHRKNLCRKLKVKNIAGVVRRGFELGLLELRPSRKITYSAALLSTAFTLLCSAVGLSQSYDAGTLLLPHTKVTLSNLPNPLCSGSSINIQTCSIPNTTNTCNTAQNVSTQNYALAEVGVPISFNMKIVMNTVLPTSGYEVIVDYIPDYGEIPDNLERIGLYGSVASDSIIEMVAFQPNEGTTFGVIRFLISGYELGAFVWRDVVEIPIAVLGPIDKEVNVLGTLTTPQVPYMVLHDPPGDGSFSTFQENIKLCRTTSTTYQESFGGGFTAALKVGIKGSVGIVLSQDYEFSIGVTQSFQISEIKTYGSEAERCIETSASFMTSELSNNIGDGSDVFIGYGETLNWGIFEEVIVDENCNLSLKNGLAYYQDGFSKFVKTQNGIETDIAFQLAIANDPNFDTLARDRAYNQAQVWQNALNENALNVQNPGPFIGSYDFDGDGLMAVESEEITVSQLKSTTIDLAIESNTSIDIVAMVGATGFTGGPQFQYTKNEGASTQNSSVNTKMVEYTLTDDDPGDSFQCDVHRDPDYGTPIFKLQDGSRTSCPYEGGIRRDLPTISASYCSKAGPYQDTFYIADVDPGEQVKLYVKVCNNNLLESRNMTWRLDANFQSVGYQFNGLENQIQNLGLLGPGQCDTIDLFLYRQNSNLVFDNLVFRLFPECLNEAILEPLLIEESDDMIVNLTFGSAGSYPPEKVQACAGCVDVLDLNAASGALSGTYSASTRIRLLPGVQIIPGSNITLDAPEVEMLEANVPATTILTVSQIGCQN